MSQKTRLLITIAAIALAVAILAVALMQCGARPTPAAATQTPGATTATMPGATAADPGTPTATPGPIPTFTKEEELVATSQHDSSQSVSSPEECTEVLKTEPWCNVTKYAKHITRPEWEALFPQAEFYLVRYDLYGWETLQQHNLLIIEQDGQRYTAETFDRLLAANGITVITDENRELVAKAFALMTIPDYLEYEIEFSGWEEGSWSSPIRLDYNYTLTVWTELQGLRIQYWFLFHDGLLLGAEGYVSEQGVGDHIDMSFETLSPPSLESLSYWRR